MYCRSRPPHILLIGSKVSQFFIGHLPYVEEKPLLKATQAKLYDLLTLLRQPHFHLSHLKTLDNRVRHHFFPNYFGDYQKNAYLCTVFTTEVEAEYAEAEGWGLHR